ncbi:MAG: 30S ribosomal protein S8 [Deltaproteobacteria bacterium]|nr:30S ribosomal protein S8 [Deltaproteobacteria bacterium]
MAVTDPIGDMLTRIRNGVRARQAVVEIRGSKINRAVLDRLLEEGYLAEVSEKDDGRQGILMARLKYDSRGESVIDGVERISKPGRRLYAAVDEIPRARSGYGTVILSTSKGVVTDRKARELGVGGEVLCSIW